MSDELVVLCGSSRYVQEMAVVGWLLEKNEGKMVMGLHLLPLWYKPKENITDHLAEHEGCAVHQDNLHLRKIDLAARLGGEVFVVDVDGYIGDSTSRELEHARDLRVPIRWYTKDVIGVECEGIKAEGMEALIALSEGTEKLSARSRTLELIEILMREGHWPDGMSLSEAVADVLDRLEKSEKEEVPRDKIEVFVIETSIMFGGIRYAGTCYTNKSAAILRRREESRRYQFASTSVQHTFVEPLGNGRVLLRTQNMDVCLNLDTSNGDDMLRERTIDKLSDDELRVLGIERPEPEQEDVTDEG